MELNGFELGTLRVRKPLVQGGMGVGVSLSGLAAAVAREGGIGVLSAAQPGFAEPDFAANTNAANLRALGREIRKAKENAEGGVIGVNIMWAANHYEEYVKCCIDNGADLIVSGAGLPTELPGMVGDADIKIAPIVSPPKTASVLLKYWDRHFHRTADMVVIEGPKAGGHLGYSPEDVARLEAEGGYEKEILEIIGIVRTYEEKYGKKIPVVFGGGVYSRADVEHYLGLGLDGVQMATRFVVTEECDASQAFKNAYLHAQKEDIQLVKSPVGLPGRAIRNRFIEATEQGRVPVDRCYHCLRRCDPANIPYCITKALVNAVEGDIDHGLVFCGENAWRLQEMTTVPRLMAELFG